MQVQARTGAGRGHGIGPAALAAMLLLAACGGANHPTVQDLAGREDLSLFRVGAVRGARDGDRLRAQAMLSDSSATLTMEMVFKIGSPTELQSGAWQWGRNNRLERGGVAARSVTFLGGQSGPPSVGGSFDLLDESGRPRYRVNLPVTELKPPAGGSAR